VRALTSRFRRHYGAHPFHLLVLVASFALVGYVVTTVGVQQLWNKHDWWHSIAVWFVGAIVLHDLVLFPVYAAADRSLAAGWRAVRGRLPERRPIVHAVNYVRIPSLASGLLFLMFFPGIIEQGSRTYRQATGLTQAPFLGRWLLITAVLFGASALAYGIRTLRARGALAATIPSSGTADGAEQD
jgi:hypothetical protein